MSISAKSRIGLLAAGALGMLAAVVLYTFWPKSPPARPRLNVLLITVDTLRADHLSCYGYRAMQTANLDRLAAEGTRFADCVTSVPITLPSHASIMTGTYPYVHGCRVNGEQPLHEANLTLAEILRAAGYTTHAEIAAFVLNARFGLDQGFDSYRDVPPPTPDAVAAGRAERPADEVCESTIAWLRDHAAQPFFVWVHLFDPHFPYAPPQPFRRGGLHPYDGEIAFVDEQVGRLVAALDALGLRDKTLVVLTADHGEGLWEHGEELHTVFVYDTTLAVPLIFRCPGLIPPGRTVTSQVRTIDIAPTILELLGLPAKQDAQGVSLAPLILNRGKAPRQLAAYGESMEPQVRFGYSALRCLRAGGWKYIHAPKPELYHIREDPGETDNLAEQYPERLQAMRERLRELIAQAPAPPWTRPSRSRLDRESARRLQSLGYLTGTGSATRDHAGTTELARFEPSGPDPKDRIEAIQWMHESTKGLRTGDLEAAMAAYRKALEADPKLAAARYLLGQALQAQGKLNEALEQYEPGTV